MSNTPAVRKNVVKRYFAKGNIYTYHIPTGERLPDCDQSSPEFQAALRAAETQAKVKSRAGTALREKIEGLQVPVTRARVRKPDMVAYTVAQCAMFTLRAKEGNVLVYHSGDLATDAHHSQPIRDKAQYILLAASFDLLTIRQERVTEGWSHYYATRTSEGLVGCPQHVLHGDIMPDEYRAIIAVNERQASQSTQRAIRDDLAITDAQAVEIRNTMIQRGWLTNGRPPELTDLGLSLLT